MFRKGFTLIEMLVVIAIIGILASMLAGPLMNARLTALKTNCTSNLKQIGVSLLMYETNNNVDPIGTAGIDTNARSALPIAALFKANLLDNSKLIYCPVGNVTLAADTDNIVSQSNATSATNLATGASTGPVTTTYLFTLYYKRGSPGNRVIAGDASASTTAAYSPNHGDSGTTAANWTNNANALCKDGSVKQTINSGTGYTVEGAQPKTGTTTPGVLWGAGNVATDGTGTQIGAYQ